MVFSGILVSGGTYWAFTFSPFGYYSPTFATQSAFFQQALTIPFAPQPQETLASAEASAGWKFVTNKRTFEMHFAVQPEKMPLLLTATNHDMLARLAGDGAMELNQTGDSVSGFHTQYRLGQILGTATLTGQRTNRFAPYYTQTGATVPPPEGTNYVSTVITLSERWFPNEASALKVMKATH